MRDFDVAIGRSFSSMHGLSDDTVFDLAGLDAFDDEDEAFERWLATVQTSSFEHILNDMLVDSGSLSRFERTA